MKIISDINQQTRQATPPEELRERFMDRSRPATEAEHWARRRIEALEADNAELVGALEGYLDAINAYARAERAYANVRENFTESIDEGKAVRAALIAASKAEGVARAAIAKVRKPI